MGTNREHTLQSQSIEPGLVRAFQFMILYWILRLTLRYLIDIARELPNWLTPVELFTVVALYSIALGLLFFIQRQKRLRYITLLLPLGFTIIALLLEKYWLLLAATEPMTAVTDLLYAFSLQLEFLFLLLIIAWQYNFQTVVLYTATVILLQWGLITGLATPTTMRWLLLPEDYIEHTLMYLLIGYIITWLMARQREQRAALTDANARLASHAATVELLAVAQERNRLARELHDTLAHSLSSLTVQLGAVGRLWAADRTKAKHLLDQADQTARIGLQEARRSLQALRAAPLEELGFLNALHELAQSFAERANLTLQWRTDPVVDGVSPTTEQAIYRIAQEALENIVRHAEAQRVTVELAQRDGQLTLTICDDGLGFDPTVTAISDSKRTRWGLHGMRERAELLGGTLDIESVQGGGTTIRGEFPLIEEKT